MYFQTDDSNTVTLDSTPKTWAKLVGGNQANAVAIAAQLQNMSQPTQQPIRLSIIQNQNSMPLSNNTVLQTSFGNLLLMLLLMGAYG